MRWSCHPSPWPVGCFSHSTGLIVLPYYRYFLLLRQLLLAPSSQLSHFIAAFYGMLFWRCRMTDEPALRLKDVAERLDLHPETVRRLLASGQLRGYRPGGTKAGWRVRKSELDRFIEARELEASGTGPTR